MWGAVLLAFLVVIGLTVASVGGVATSQETAHDSLLIESECVDDAGTITVTNPNDAAAETNVIWEGTQSTIQVTAEAGSQTDGTADRALATELDPESLNVTIPADETVTISGLEDGTYEFAAVIDGKELTLDGKELTLECGADHADKTTTTTTEEVDKAVAEKDDKVVAEKDDKKDADEKDEKDDKKDADEKDEKDVDEKDDKKDADEKDVDEKDDKKDADEKDVDEKDDKKDADEKDEKDVDEKDDKKDADEKDVDEKDDKKGRRREGRKGREGRQEGR
ncbi:hypothetical protein [Natronorubrum tibetense]|uniref:hypothetical protein n=1 Tax=Natronorubrum tibetense TaxID=63128 RepID=UPI00047F8D8A|nr:hypothetical protein [Natronorubrum tibetense]